jgi:hypothetical protein
LRVLLIVAVALLGGAIGAGIVTFLPPTRAPHRDASGLDAKNELDAVASDQVRYAARLSALEAANARLVAAGNAASSSASASAPRAAEQDLPPRETPAEQRGEQEALLAAHAVEPLDPRWARTTGAELQRGLDALKSPGEMKVTELTCRSQTCLARLSWPSMAAAYGVRRDVLTLLSIDLPCERRLYLGEEGQGHDAFEGTLMLSCSQ